jgi:hypothetical protein
MDVGGGLAHGIVGFQAEIPSLPGKLILHDLLVVIESANDLPENIEVMGHNLFTQQPVRAAKVCYLRIVLHDWPE